MFPKFNGWRIAYSHASNATVYDTWFPTRSGESSNMRRKFQNPSSGYGHRSAGTNEMVQKYKFPGEKESHYYKSDIRRSPARGTDGETEDVRGRYSVFIRQRCVFHIRNKNGHGARQTKQTKALVSGSFSIFANSDRVLHPTLPSPSTASKASQCYYQTFKHNSWYGYAREARYEI